MAAAIAKNKTLKGLIFKKGVFSLARTFILCPVDSTAKVLRKGLVSGAKNRHNEADSRDKGYIFMVLRFPSGGVL